MARLKEEEILELLLEDFQDKKQFQPYKPTDCEFCGKDIEEGDDFVFIGSSKRKMCSDCQEEVTNELENKISEI